MKNYKKDNKNIDLELDFLNIGDIYSISKEIKKLIENEKTVIHVGHCKMLESQKINHINPKDFDIDSLIPADTVVITNPVILSYIFSDYKYYLKNIAEKVKNQFIFTLPSFVKRDDIEIYWDTNFSYLETDNNKYKRWFASRTANKAKIFIYNHSKRIKKVRVYFELYILDRFSSVKISYFDNLEGGGGSISKLYGVNDDMVIFDKNVLLYPGNNKLQIEYFGELYIREDGDIRPLLFTVIDFHIEDNTNILSGTDAYNKSSHDSFLDYFEDNDRIRSCLHASGFFDVISYESIENRDLLKSRYTRYYVCDLLYRDVEIFDRNYNDERMKLNLFLAKRNGIIDESQE